MHVWIWMCHCLIYDAPWAAPQQLHTRLLFNHDGNDMRLCVDTWCWLNIWNGVGVMLALDEQEVRWYWYVFQFECAIAWYTMHHERHHDNCTPACRSTTMAMILYGSALIFDVDWIYGTVSCWLWTNRKYVGIDIVFYLNVSLLDIRCAISGTGF